MPFRDLSFAAQVDEIRVSLAALDGLSQGFRLTELRRRAACDVPFERLELEGGSECRPAPRFAPPHSEQGGLRCEADYEPCGVRPGMCVPSCPVGRLRQPDCTCDCLPGSFQAWRALKIRLTGNRYISNVTVYDSEHQAVEHLAGGELPLTLQLAQATTVAVVTVRGTSPLSAKAVSLKVVTPDGKELAVPGLRDVPLSEERDSILHHRRAHEFFDASLTCAACPGGALGSQLPRSDSLSCLCNASDGRNLLGRCEPLLGHTHKHYNHNNNKNSNNYNANDDNNMNINININNVQRQ